MIDLHLHTTASDGSSTPEALVREAALAGLRTIAVTDHDTLAAVPAVARAAATAGLECIAGIEITAVYAGKDVHVLGYFVDPSDAEMNGFLGEQREDRRRRASEIADRLDRLGAPIDRASLLSQDVARGRSLGRPVIAAALVAAGHARDVADAFERFLAEGRPAFVERRGESPAAVVRRIQRVGGLASLAHPGKLGLDSLVADLAEAGMTAVEVFHPDHSDTDVLRYRAFAAAHGLLVTGGSDYHGPENVRAGSLGRVVLPPDAYAALVERASG